MKIKEESRFVKQSLAYFGTRHETFLASKNESFEEEVLFISSRDSEAATLWVNYLTACFEQISRQQGRSPFNVKNIAVEDPLLPGTEERIKNSRLQIVIVCPVLLERVLSRPEQAASLSSYLATDRVLAMMLGVQETHVTNGHKSSLISYQNWRKFFVKDQDETFVGEFLGAAVAILGCAASTTLKNDKTTFSVHPKKVKLGQNRILALLNDPLRAEDIVTVIVDRCGEAIEISHVKKRNPYVLQFSIPERCLEVSMLVGVRISRNGYPLGVRQVKCESRLRELDQILRAHDNPLEFMCQTFGFKPGDREQLDNWMVHAFQRNLPPHFNLLSNPHGLTPPCKNYTRRLPDQEENPTLLHFAARFGLEKLAWQLLECPGGDVACDMRNVADMTPADLAEQAGHSRLAHQLRGYMQMNEFTNMYSYLKVMSESTHENMSGNEKHLRYLANEKEGEKEEYCRPRPLSEAYSVPPAARPVTSINLTMPPQLPSSNAIPNTSLEANYLIAPTPLPIHSCTSTASTPTPTLSISNNGLDLSLQGYLQMNPAGLKMNNSTTPSSRVGTPTQLTRQDSNSSRFRDDVNQITSSSTVNQAQKSREPSGPQDELLEIINDFKNNVFTISEVERLVETWRNRNDVQQSFKDKQRQLNAMREEYERIQKRIKDETKMPTPFDRIRKFFGKGKKDSSKDLTNTNDECSSTSKNDNLNNSTTDRRPVSSLSLHSVSSSSSSGRMSTVSGCSGISLGDSGTHSDTEDRRLQNSREEKIGIMSYEVPPAPKPFTGRYSPIRYTPSPRSSCTHDFELRTCNSKTLLENKEYYISFPPSGLPIHSFNADGTPKEPKTPCTPVERSDFLDLVEIDIPENQANVEALRKNNSYANIDPLQNSTPLPPPDMCIPKEYMNFSTIRELSALEQNSEVQSVTSEQNENEEKIEKNENENTEITEMIVSSRKENEKENIDRDVTDSTAIPQYMNVTLAEGKSGDEIGWKKPPAPPVPPRMPTKN